MKGTSPRSFFPADLSSSTASISYRYGARNTPKRKKIDRWIGELNGRMNNGPAWSVKKIIEWETGIFIAPRGCCASIKPEWKQQVSLFLPLPPFFLSPFLFSRSTLGCDRIPIGGRAFAIHVSRDLCNIGQWTRSNFALGFARRATWVADRCCDRTFAVDASTVRVESSVYRENVSKPFFFSSFFARNREREYIYIYPHSQPWHVVNPFETRHRKFVTRSFLFNPYAESVSRFQPIRCASIYNYPKPLWAFDQSV